MSKPNAGPCPAAEMLQWLDDTAQRADVERTSPSINKRSTAREQRFASHACMSPRLNELRRRFLASRKAAGLDLSDVQRFWDRFNELFWKAYAVRGTHPRMSVVEMDAAISGNRFARVREECAYGHLDLSDLTIGCRVLADDLRAEFAHQLNAGGRTARRVRRGPIVSPEQAEVYECLDRTFPLGTRGAVGRLKTDRDLDELRERCRRCGLKLEWGLISKARLHCRRQRERARTEMAGAQN
jgi:hypothetical protein